jgi:spore coat polysaccharide biosynthesis protein SpsF
MGSTRLPGKVLRDIEGKPMLEWVIERLKMSKLVDQIIVAVASGEENKSIVKLCKSHGVSIFIGSEEDVLDRYYQAAKKFNADVIVRITSDCPLIDPQIVDKVINVYLENKNKADYVSNTLHRTYPRGLDVEVFTFKSLERAWKKAKKPYQREHVTPYFYENPRLFRCLNVRNEENLSSMRWTVDEERDLKFVREVYKRFKDKSTIPLMKDILEVLKKEPYLEQINLSVKQKNLKERNA